MRWRWLQSMIGDFRAGKPGRRFLTVYEHRRLHRREHPVRAWIFVGFGFLFLVVGVIIALPPGVPGFFLWIPGLLMIATRLRWAAALLDKVEGVVEGWVVRFRAWRTRRKSGKGG